MARPDDATAFYIKADTPANAEAVVSEIKNVPHMETYGVHSMSEYLSMLTPDNIPMLSTFIHIVIGISVTIGFIVIFQAMYAAVMERTREIGILKSLGASRFYIINAILRETALLSIGGIIVGIVISLATSATIEKRTTCPSTSPPNGSLLPSSLRSSDRLPEPSTPRSKPPKRSHRRFGLRMILELPARALDRYSNEIISTSCHNPAFQYLVFEFILHQRIKIIACEFPRSRIMTGRPHIERVGRRIAARCTVVGKRSGRWDLGGSFQWPRRVPPKLTSGCDETTT